MAKSKEQNFLDKKLIYPNKHGAYTFISADEKKIPIDLLGILKAYRYYLKTGKVNTE